MHAGLKITAFAAALVATFGTAYGVGQGVGPVTDDETPARHDAHTTDSESGQSESSGHSGHESPPAGDSRSPRTATPSTCGPHDSRPDAPPTSASPSGARTAARSPPSAGNTTRNSTS